MLYTLSKAQYDQRDLTAILEQICPTDALVLWQDGVLQAVKNPHFFANIKHVFVLKNDVQARHIQTDLPQISLEDLVELTEKFSPQIAL